MKRYVLLEDNSIVDTSKQHNFRFYTDNYASDMNADIYHDNSQPIKQQSDNLLDLVEDKDLIELGNEDNVIQYDIVYDEITSYKNIVAIWKRQCDIMRRYEVEEHNDK